MENTSPRHMPVLGNVHPIKIEHFSWRHFSARSSFFILLIDRATQEVPMKTIWKKLSVQFLRYAIELLGLMYTDEAWRHVRTLHFYPEYIDLPGVCIQKFVMIHLIIILQ